MEWEDIPTPIRNQIEYFLDHPETGVRRGRPKRHIDAHDAGHARSTRDKLSTSDSPRSTHESSGGCS